MSPGKPADDGIIVGLYTSLSLSNNGSLHRETWNFC